MDARRVFGLRLKEFREAQSLTQEELAGRVERSVDAISKLERGVGYPSLETLISLARELRTPATKLLEPFEKTAARSAQRIRLDAKLMALSAQMDERQLNIAIEQIKVLIAGSGRR